MPFVETDQKIRQALGLRSAFKAEKSVLPENDFLVP